MEVFTAPRCHRTNLRLFKLLTELEMYNYMNKDVNKESCILLVNLILM